MAHLVLPTLYNSGIYSYILLEKNASSQRMTLHCGSCRLMPGPIKVKEIITSITSYLPLTLAFWLWKRGGTRLIMMCNSIIGLYCSSQSRKTHV